MTPERMKLNVELLNKRMKELLSECPEISDLGVIVIWDRSCAKLASELQIPSSLVFSNRKDNSEIIDQGMSISATMIATAQALYERSVKLLHDTISAMQPAAKPEDTEKPADPV